MAYMNIVSNDCSAGSRKIISARVSHAHQANGDNQTSFDDNFRSYLRPRSPLTDQLHQDFQALISEAASMWADGRHDDARRVAGLASHLLRSDAPAAE